MSGGNAFPWLPWFHRDFLAATQGWTLLERGAYFMLINAQWEMGPLPDDRRRLAGIIGAQLDELEDVWPVVGAKFDRTKRGLVNQRLEKHRARQVAKSRRAQGSARARWGKTFSADSDLDANACAGASGNHSEGHANGHATTCANSMLPDPDPEPETKEKEDFPLANARGAPVAAAPVGSSKLTKSESSRFAEFWEAYPKKVKRKEAQRIWRSSGMDELTSSLVADVKQRIAHDGRWLKGFVPDPTTYLRGERWNDAIEPARADGRGDAVAEQAAKERDQIMDLAALMRIEQQEDDWSVFRQRVLTANARRVRALTNRGSSPPQ